VGIWGNRSVEETGSANRLYLTQLHSLLLKHFSQGELKTLCFYLDVDYDTLNGEGKANKARELVQHLERCGRLADLRNEVVKQRPHVLWPEIPQDISPRTREIFFMSNILEQPRKSIIIGVFIVFLLIIGAISDAFGVFDGIKSLFSPHSTVINSFDYQIRVEDKSTNQPIQNAKVIIEGSGFAPKNSIADVNGNARIFVDVSHAGKPGLLIVEALGYKRYVKNIDLIENELPDIVSLEPQQ
jgi:hypothetical protein